MVVHRDVIVEKVAGERTGGMRISWGGIIGGVLVAIGTLLLLATLGLAVGITAVDPASPGGIGVGAAIWSSLALLIALFVGGFAATRMSMVWERGAAMLQGVLVWVVAMVAMLYLTASGIGLIVGAAGGLVSNAAQAAAGAASSTSDELSSLSMGDVDTMIERLRSPETASRLATVLGMSQADVASTLDNIAADVEAVRENPAEAAAAVRRGAADLMSRAGQRMTAAAESVQPEVATAAWSTFIAMLIALGAAVGGAAVGRRGAAEKGLKR